MINVPSEEAAGCCAALRKALLASPEMDTWTCPKCGMEWRPRIEAGMRYWEAHPIIQVWR
jgi:hypothetical protein